MNLNKIIIHFFNVRHGDSILIEYCYEEATKFVVIDCNTLNRKSPIVAFLKGKSEIIDCLILTHFHIDHIRGIKEIVDNFDIKQLCIPPYFDVSTPQFSDQLLKARNAIASKASNSLDRESAKALSNYVALYQLMEKSISEEKIRFVEGPESILRFATGEEIGKVLLPLKGDKSQYLNQLKKYEYKIEAYTDLNSSSIALLLNNFEKFFLFAGDTINESWTAFRKINKGYKNLGLSILKCPHHGGGASISSDLFSYFFDPAIKPSYIAISANGISHPHQDIFSLIKQFNLTPLCTNRSKYCPPVKDIIWENYAEHAAFFLSQVPVEYETNLSACQDSIVFSVSQSEFGYESSKMCCPYHTF